MVSALLVPSVALAGAKDSSASALADDAMQTDYAATKFKKAEQKLKKALTQCGTSACSDEVVARLHRDLATVYIAGSKQSAKGKAELKQALKANPDLELDEDLATPELRKEFKALGGHEPKPKEEESSKEEQSAKADDCEPGSEGCEKDEAKPAVSSDASGYSKNWISLHFEQDFLLFSATDNVCASFGRNPEAPGFSCFQNGSPFGDAAGEEIQTGVGNHVTSGIGRATSRVLVGFDRLLGSNVSLGARVGFAFGGAPPRASAKFLPLHGELRLNYWFGTEPFASSGLRPYVSLSGGVAQMDSRVTVEYYDLQGKKTSLDAWRKTGKGFAGLGFGMMIPIGGSGIIPELRALRLFGDGGTAFDVALGYAYGF